jgi:transposase
MSFWSTCPASAARSGWCGEKRTWRCAEAACTGKAFTEQQVHLARPRALLTTRACWWAIGQLRREHASVAGIARQLGTTWRTVWRSIQPLLEAMAADETRFADVTSLGVDEHIWHHVFAKPVEDGGRGPKELTGMVDLTRDSHGRVRARLLDLVPGRSGKAYADWLTARGEAFWKRVQVATLDPFHGYKNAIDDQLEDATAVLDAFHVVKLGTDAVDRCRRRIQQEIHGHRGRRNEPLYGIRTMLRAGAENLTDRQWARLQTAFAADERHLPVWLAWSCAQQLRSAYRHERTTEGRKIAEKVIDSFPTCPVPEIARLGRTLKQWREAFLAYFDTNRASNGGTEAVNGLIELHRRIARGFRNRGNYRLRMLLIAGGLTSPHLK